MIATRKHLPGIIRTVIIVISLLMVIFPIFFLLMTSLKPSLEVFNNPSILPSRIIWTNFEKVLQDNDSIYYMMNSVIVTVVTTVVTVLLGSMAAYSLSRLGYGFIISIVSVIIITVRFYPKITVIIPYFLLMKEMELLDTNLAVILSHISMALPLTVLLMMTFFNELPKEIEESCRIDGGSVVTTYFRIIMPITAAGMAASGILTAILSWNEFLIASSVAASDAKTLPVVIAGFITDKGTDWGGMSAFSVIVMVPMVIMALFTQRYLVSGMTAGAVKG